MAFNQIVWDDEPSASGVATTTPPTTSAASSTMPKLNLADVTWDEPIASPTLMGTRDPKTPAPAGLMLSDVQWDAPDQPTTLPVGIDINAVQCAGDRKRVFVRALRVGRDVR